MSLSEWFVGVYSSGSNLLFYATFYDIIIKDKEYYILDDYYFNFIIIFCSRFKINMEM